jgi:hypothetical protein
MNRFQAIFAFLLLWTILASCNDDDPKPEPQVIHLLSVNVGSQNLSFTQPNTNMPIDKPVVAWFDQALDTTTVRTNIKLFNSQGNTVPVIYSYLDDFRAISILPQTVLGENAGYRLSLGSGLKGKKNEIFAGIDVSFATLMLPLTLKSVTIDAKAYYGTSITQNVSLKPEITLQFTHPIAPAEVLNHIKLLSATGSNPLMLLQSGSDSIVTVQPTTNLQGLAKHTIAIDNGLTSVAGNSFNGFEGSFYTIPSPTPLMPVVSDEELLTLVQRHTFNYFWNFAHPVSGMARERNTSGDVVTTGGTGFGLMALIVGMERGFIHRNEGVQRLKTIVGFLTTANRFHGVWPHWLNGSTGKVQPFSTYDNGGDLVETSFLVAGMLAVRQYLRPTDSEEQALISQINTLVNEVEWDWYTQGQKVLYWHWSPNYAWTMNHKIQGYNEALITYVLAASSTTHGIDAEVYKNGWAANGGIANGKTFYGITLPLGYDLGGPLFFSQYSFLGLDPRNLSDDYCSYWTQNVNHTLINHAYCVNNPNGFIGYSAECWGLTASDNHQGYSAHSPSNDLGVISPTAAISSIPYTPDQSLSAIKFFYYKLGDRLWGEYGFYDAFQLTNGWTANSYLAIDQGPIVVMIENYRTGLLWNLFMTCPEVRTGLTKLGFTY